MIFACSGKFRVLSPKGFAVALATFGFCSFTAGTSQAVTANGTVSPGDVFIVNNFLTGFSQIEEGTRAGGAVAYGNANEQLGGVFADASGIYFAGNPNAAGITVERIAVGQTISTPILGPGDFAGASGTVLRDLAVMPSGTIFTLYNNGLVDQFIPLGGGTYSRTAVPTGFTGFTGADRGSGHQLSVSLNGDYLLTSSRTQNRIWSLNISTGVVQQWTVPVGLLGPFTGTQLTLSATSVLDPVRGDRLIVPMSNDGLYEVLFDPVTGTFPNAAPLRLSNDAIASFVDAVGFDGEGDLIVSTRDSGTIGSLREFTQAELAAASAGTQFSLMTKTPFYSAGDARIARDLAVVVPEPGAAALVAIAASLFVRRRRGLPRR